MAEKPKRDFVTNLSVISVYLRHSPKKREVPVCTAADVADIYLRGLRLNQILVITKPTFLQLVGRFPPRFFNHMRTE